MTLDELRAHLNALRTDEAWRRTWQERGYDVSDVCLCLREMLHEAKMWTLSEAEYAQTHLQAWVRHIVAFASGELLSAPSDYAWPVSLGLKFVRREPRRTVPAADPECFDEEEGRQAWIKFITTCNQQWTFKQATAWFHRVNGYWPKWNWPGLPRSSTHRLRRIASVGPELLYPGLPVHETGPIPD